jgi:hypothetical protein
LGFSSSAIRDLSFSAAASVKPIAGFSADLGGCIGVKETLILIVLFAEYPV